MGQRAMNSFRNGNHRRIDWGVHAEQEPFTPRRPPGVDGLLLLGASWCAAVAVVFVAFFLSGADAAETCQARGFSADTCHYTLR